MRKIISSIGYFDPVSFDAFVVSLPQGFMLNRSVPATAAFVVCKFLGGVFADSEKYNPILAINQKITTANMGPIRWLRPCIIKLAPIALISLSTAVHSLLYNYFSSIFAKGLIIGWHSITAQDCAAFFESGFGGLREDALSWRNKMPKFKGMDDSQNKTCAIISTLAIDVFYTVTYIWFTRAECNPILATTNGWIAGAISSLITAKLYGCTLPPQARS